MTRVTRADCFENNIFFLRILGAWPANKNGEIMENYFIYSYAFRSFFVLLYVALLTVNLLTIYTEIAVLIEECLFYFTEIAVLSKALLFYSMHDRIMDVLTILDGDTFSPKTSNGIDRINKAIKFYKRYWRIITMTSVIAHIANASVSLLNYFIRDQTLSMPVSSYEFLDENILYQFAWPIYLYQILGITSHMLYNVNIDTFIVGLLVTVTAQLDILDENLRNINMENNADLGRASEEFGNINISYNAAFVGARHTQEILSSIGKEEEPNVKEKTALEKLNNCVLHYQVIAGYCSAIQDAFSLLLCIQFSLSAIVICVCLFRLTWECTPQYYLFILSYLSVMLSQTLVPCWFGNDIILKSSSLGIAAYSCGWVNAGPQIKIHLRLLCTRTMRPLTIVAGKIFPLSLQTFRKIMNTSYSYFALLRNVQMREMEADMNRM